MPAFLCPCCGTTYRVPLAYCDWLLEERLREGWAGGVAPARCLDCSPEIAAGDAVTLRGGRGVTPAEDERDLPAGGTAVIAGVSAWKGEGSIYLVRLAEGVEVDATRAQLAPARADPA